MPSLIPPVPIGLEDYNEPPWIQFFEALRKFINSPPVYEKTSDPTTSDIPVGSWGVWKNSTSGTVRLWTNDGGIMKSVTLT